MASFLDREVINKALQGIDAVFHLVSTTFPATSNADPDRDVRENLIGSLMLIEAMETCGVGRIVFLSSGGTVYGAPRWVPITEDHPLSPVTSYAIVKIAIEHYLRMYGALKGLSHIIVRASNPYGPRQAHVGTQGIVSTFMRRARAGDPVEVWGDGSIVRDYLYVTDLAAFCVLAASTDCSGTYNVGSSSGTTVNGVISAIRSVANAPLRVVYRPGRNFDVPNSVLDCSRARAEFGWSPKVSFEQGIRHLWEWLDCTGVR